MRTIRIFACALCATTLASCGTPSEVRTEGPIAIRARWNAVELRNRGSEPVYFFLIEMESEESIRWVPCTDPLTCDGLDPGEHRRIPYGTISGYDPGDVQAVLYWWHLRSQAGGGFQFENLGVARIRL